MTPCLDATTLDMGLVLVFWGLAGGQERAILEIRTPRWTIPNQPRLSGLRLQLARSKMDGVLV